MLKKLGEIKKISNQFSYVLLLFKFLYLWILFKNMKKRLFLVLSLLGIYVSGQETIFSEDFNSGTMPTGWTMLDRDRDGSSWKIMQGDFRTKSAGWNGNTGYMFVSEGYK